MVRGRGEKVGGGERTRVGEQTFKSAARVAAVQRTRLSGFNYKRTLRALVNNALNFEIDKISSLRCRALFPV